LVVTITKRGKFLVTKKRENLVVAITKEGGNYNKKEKVKIYCKLRDFMVILGI